MRGLLRPLKRHARKKRAVVRYVSDPRPEPPLPPEGIRCVCGTLYLRRRMDCSICDRPAPEAAQPVYHRPLPPPRARDGGALPVDQRPGYWGNKGRMAHQSKALTPDQIAIMLALRTEGKGQVEIATQLGVNQATISRTLARYPDTRAQAKLRLINSADTMARHILKAAQAAADEGDASPALEVLDRLDVLPAKRQAPQAAGGTRVLVVVGGTPEAARIDALPDFSALPPPLATPETT